MFYKSNAGFLFWVWHCISLCHEQCQRRFFFSLSFHRLNISDPMRFVNFTGATKKKKHAMHATSSTFNVIRISTNVTCKPFAFLLGKNATTQWIPFSLKLLQFLPLSIRDLFAVISTQPRWIFGSSQRELNEMQKKNPSKMIKYSYKQMNREKWGKSIRCFLQDMHLLLLSFFYLLSDTYNAKVVCVLLAVCIDCSHIHVGRCRKSNESQLKSSGANKRTNQKNTQSLNNEWDFFCCNFWNRCAIAATPSIRMISFIFVVIYLQLGASFCFCFFAMIFVHNSDD